MNHYAYSMPSVPLADEPLMVQEAIFKSDLFSYFQEHPERMSAVLLIHLASIVKAAAGGVPDLLSRGHETFEKFFATTPLGPQCGSIYDAAPTTSVSYQQLEDDGVPSKLCPVNKGGPLEELMLLRALEREADANRFLFDSKRSGYIECDESGEWDEEVTSEKVFKAHWGARIAAVDQARVLPFFDAIRSFSRRGYFPHAHEPLVKYKGIWWFNEYRPPQLVPVPGDWSDYDALTLHLVGGDVKAQQYLLDWLAAPLQSLVQKGKPLKMQTIQVFYPAKGSGKGLLAMAMREMYGASNVVIFGQDQLDSRFTGALRNKLFVILNEVMSSTNRSQETANKIKALATDVVIASEAKNVEADNITNTFNLIVLSNDERPVLVEDGDRRFTVHEQRQRLDAALGKRIAADREGNMAQLAAFYSHLLTRQVCLDVGDLYETEARVRLMRESGGSATRFWRDVAEEGWLSLSATWNAQKRPGMDDPYFTSADGACWVASEWIEEVYIDWCRRTRLKAEGGNKLWEALKAVVPEVVKGNPRWHGRKTRAWGKLPGVPLEVVKQPEVAASDDLDLEVCRN